MIKFSKDKSFFYEKKGLSFEKYKKIKSFFEMIRPLIFTLVFSIVTILVGSSINFQIKRIRQKLKKKSKKENDFLAYPKFIIIKNKNTLSRKFIYLINRFFYHLGSVILLVFFYKYVLFSINLVFGFFDKRRSIFFIKKKLTDFLDPITTSLYSKFQHFYTMLEEEGHFDMKTGKYISDYSTISSYPTDLSILMIRLIYPILILTLIFLFFDFLLKKEFFKKEKQIKLIEKKSLVNALSIAFLIIILYAVICSILIFYECLSSKNLNLKDFFISIWYTILSFYWIVFTFVIRYPFCLPILATVFYCFSSRLRDLKALIREIRTKLKRI